MDGAKICLVEPLDDGGRSCQPPELCPSSNDNTPTKVPKRKGSVFSLAGSFFKSHGKNDELDQPRKPQDSSPIKGSWNLFTSLRLKESKRKSTSFDTNRCKSSSPQKVDTLKFDEIGKRKTMRRKSLQDLLGTMGTKLSRGRRQVVEEVNSPTCEDPDDEQRYQTFLSPVPAQLGRDKASESPNYYHSGLKLMQFSDSKLGTKGSDENPFTISPSQIVPNNDDSTSERSIEQTNTEVPALIKCTGVSPTDEDVAAYESIEGSGASGLHNSIQISTTSLPEKVCNEELVGFLQDVSSQMQKHITFSGGEPPSNRTKSTAASTFLYTVQKDNPFGMDTKNREELFDSTFYESLPSTTDVSSKDIAKHIISTTAKISNNYHLSQSQNRRFLDNSESETDNISHCSWDETQPEVWNVIDKGQEVMAKTMPTACLYPGAMPETSSMKAALGCPSNEVSLAAGESPESFSGLVHIGLEAPKAEENISSDSVQIFHPRSGFCGPFTSRHISISDALSELCHNTSYSIYCLFDRKNMALIPQPLGGYLDAERPQQFEGGLEVIQLQTEPRSEQKASVDPPLSRFEFQEAPSVHVPGSSLSMQCMPLVNTLGSPVSGLGSVVSKFSENQLKRVESIYESETDSLTAGYSLSSYSTTDSMNPNQSSELVHTDSSYSANLETYSAVSKNTELLKTWADPRKEFLHEHASDINSSPKIAVQETLKSGHEPHSFHEVEQNIATSSDPINSRDIKDVVHRKWSYDEGTSNDISLYDTEDIAEQESVKEYLQDVPMRLSTIIDFLQPSKSNTTRGSSGIGKKKMVEALRSPFRVETLASQKTLNANLGLGYMNPICPITIYRMSDKTIQQDQTEGWVSNTAVSEIYAGIAKDEISYAGVAGTPKISVDIITQDNDEPGPTVAKTSRNVWTPAESPQPKDYQEVVPLASIQNMSGSSVTTNPVYKGGRHVAASIPEFENEPILSKGKGNSEFAGVITDRISTYPAVLEATSTTRALLEFRSQSLTSAEAPSGSLSPVPRLPTPLTWAKISPYSPVIPSPLSGQKRAQTPDNRVLATVYQASSFDVQNPAPPPSEADTEESFDFGLELQRCALTREDDKENGGRQNTSFTLYGHRIHYTDLKDTI